MRVFDPVAFDPCPYMVRYAGFQSRDDAIDSCIKRAAQASSRHSFTLNSKTMDFQSQNTISTPDGTPLLIIPRAPKNKASKRRLFNDNRDQFEDSTLTIDETPKKRKAVKQNTSEETNKQVCQLNISSNRYVVAKEFQGRMLIHVRVYENSRKGQLIPTKQGIALDLEKWKKIHTWCAGTVDEAVTDYKQGSKQVNYERHLGNNYYISVKSGYPVVDIRKWFLPEGENEVKPTKKGIALTFGQWEKLKETNKIIEEKLGEQLDQVEFCELSTDHQNQMGALQCPNCNPNGYSDMF